MKLSSLTASEKQDLGRLHRYEHDGRVRDRIKAELLKNEGWKNKEIPQALRIHEETHYVAWFRMQK